MRHTFRFVGLWFAVAWLASCAGGVPSVVVDADPDGDGVRSADRCPADAEDVDGFADEDGCPDADDDTDTIGDVDDACPNEPEDVDGYRDADGCPDLDDDGDRILDADDRCPCVPEVFNGHEDEDGCPDCGPVLLIEERITILERAWFARVSAVLEGQSVPIVDAVARTLVGNTFLLRVEVAGHASDDEPRAQALSEARANAVLERLVANGVARERLVAVGYGAGRPFEPGRTRRARESNRRVEFPILESNQPSQGGCTTPPPVEGCTRAPTGP